MLHLHALTVQFGFGLQEEKLLHRVKSGCIVQYECMQHNDAVHYMHAYADTVGEPACSYTVKLLMSPT